MFTFACKDMELECPFTVDATTKEELLMQVSDHAAGSHGMTPDQMTPELEEKLNAAIKEA